MHYITKPRTGRPTRRGDKLPPTFKSATLYTNQPSGLQDVLGAGEIPQGKPSEKDAAKNALLLFFIMKFLFSNMIIQKVRDL